MKKNSVQDVLAQDVSATAHLAGASARHRVLSGMQPSADSLHLGNYLGALVNWERTQADFEAFFFIPDLHAITVPQDPAALAERTRVAAAQFIAGGIGITPIVGAAQALARRDAAVTLHYAVRTRGDAAYLDRLERLLGDRLIVHAADEGRRLDLERVFADLPQDTMTLFCGPMRMLDAARHAWEASGRPMTDLRYETFGSSGLLPTEAFRVRLAGQGGELGTEFVIPRDRSMLDVLNEAGHEVMSDCRRGECGVCALDVVDVDGEIDHRDVFFSAHQKRESRKICACVSRARGTITVDTLHRADTL